MTIRVRTPREPRRSAPFRHTLSGIILLLALSGCAQPQPQPQLEPSSSPHGTPTATAAPAAATLVVDGSGLVLLSESGGELSRIAYSDDPEQAIAALTEAVGSSPQRGVEGQQTCFGEYDTARWGESLALKHGEALPLPADAAFEIDATGAEAGAIAVQTPQGFSVGDPIAELTASVPEAPAVQFETGGALVNFDVVTGTEQDGAEPYYGAQATDLEATGTIREIRAPLDFRFDC